MKKITAAIVITLMSFNSLSQNITIPDPNFKSFLIADAAINTNGDAEIQLSEAQAYTGSMDCSNLGIVNMTGIEPFVNLTNLNCSNNGLGSLDISSNVALTQFRCYDNNITSLDLSNNTQLVGFSCAFNQLTQLDVSNNTQLESFACSNNNITSLDVSNNVSLEWLWCGWNELTSIDISQNVALTNFYCDGNDLTTLDLSNNTELVSVFCFENELTGLEILYNTQLTDLLCAKNSIVSLDASLCSHLDKLDCSSNALTKLNLANGNNVNIESIEAHGNPNLTCVQVDDEAFSTANWVQWDFIFGSGVQFSENCDLLDVAEESLELEMYPMPVNNLLNIQLNEHVEYSILSMDGKSIQSGELIAGFNQLQLNFLPSGSYTLLLTTDTGAISVEKIAKM